MRKAKSQGTRVGSRIIAGLTELVEAVERGEKVETRFTVRTVELNLKPNHYDRESVRLTRLRLGVSQTVFAHILGVAVETIEAWEQGTRHPSQMACRLLDEINENTQRWIRKLEAALKEKEAATSR